MPFLLAFLINHAFGFTNVQSTGTWEQCPLMCLWHASTSFQVIPCTEHETICFTLHLYESESLENCPIPRSFPICRRKVTQNPIFFLPNSLCFGRNAQGTIQCQDQAQVFCVQSICCCPVICLFSPYSLTMSPLFKAFIYDKSMGIKQKLMWP